MDKSFPHQGYRECVSVEDTHVFGEELGRALQAGDVVLLSGPLGAGKTTLTQGIARGMGVKGRVTSPTFVVAREHKSLTHGPALIHVDAYRLLGNGADPLGELDALDLDTQLCDGVVVAEWGEGLAEALNEEYLLIRLNREREDDVRVLTWQWVHP